MIVTVIKGKKALRGFISYGLFLGMVCVMCMDVVLDGGVWQLVSLS